MKKLLYVLILVLPVLSISQTTDTEKYTIERANANSVHSLGISKFYFAHHLFADSFYLTDLYKILSYDEMADIIKNVYNGITNEDKVRVVYNTTQPTSGIMAYFIKDTEKDGKILAMLTTFNSSKREFEKELDSKNHLARWYFLRGDKMVYRKDVYTKELEKEKTTEDPSDLIGLYMFDDNFENDANIKPQIDLTLKSENIHYQFYGYLYLCEYYLMNNQIEESEKALKEMQKLFDENENEIPRTDQFYINMVTTEYEVMKRM